MKNGLLMVAGIMVVILMMGFLEYQPDISEAEAKSFAKQVIGSEVVTAKKTVVKGRTGYVMELKEAVQGSHYWVVTTGDAAAPKRKSPLRLDVKEEKELISLLR